MTVKVGMITFDSSNPRELAGWWAQQLSGTLVDEAGGFFLMVTPPGGGPTLGFQMVENPTPGKNKIHLDLSSTDRVADVAALVAAGATEHEVHDIDGFSWTTLADPQGNLFCVAEHE